MKAHGLVLAGAPNTGRLKEVSGAPLEALIPVAGRPLVDYVAEALAGATALERVVVVGPEQELAYLREKGVEVVAGPGGLTPNLAEGLRTLPPEALVVVATADIPLLTPVVVDAFLGRCLALGEYDFYYSVVSQAAILEKFPQARRSWIRLADGAVTGGNLFVVRPAAALAILPVLKRVTDLRKSALGLAAMLGPALVGKYLLGRLTLAEAERRVRSVFRISGRAVLVDFPEVGIDVDKPVDLRLVESILAAR